METVINTVVALCMFVAGELKEHRIQDKCQIVLKVKEKLREMLIIILNINVAKWKLYERIILMAVKV